MKYNFGQIYNYYPKSIFFKLKLFKIIVKAVSIIIMIIYITNFISSFNLFISFILKEKMDIIFVSLSSSDLYLL